ncbi:MAG: hypothetical protein K2M91_06340 [Lachnospiraceae bacterium]|nr:hypothetical protein [Lachnospiraceae bacterium]
MKEKRQKTGIKIVGFMSALIFATIPFWGSMSIRYGVDQYAKKRAIIVDNCVIKSIVEAPKETLFVVEFSQTENTSVSDLHIVHAYGKWEKDKQKAAVGDMITCSFPERDTSRKGYAVW